MIQASVARSELVNSRAAALEATQKAVAGLGGAKPVFSIVFATARHDQQQVLQAVQSETNQAPLSGCSAEGIISGERSDEADYAVVVMVIASDRITFEPFMIEGYGENSQACGVQIANLLEANKDADVAGMILLPDGLVGNCADFLKGLTAAAQKNIATVGGSAADGMAFMQTYQYHDDKVSTGAVAGFFVRGPAKFAVATSHGCTPLGLERTITKAEGGWVYEIDGKSAWSVFREYLDGDPQDLNAEGIVHICVGEKIPVPKESSYPPYIIRTPLKLDKEKGALFFPGGGFTSGTRVRLTRRDADMIKKSATDCAKQIVQVQNSDPALILQFDCAGRGKIMFGACAAEEVVKPLREVFGTKVPWAGFHTYGEIAPVGGAVYYHNYTVAVCALYEQS